MPDMPNPFITEPDHRFVLNERAFMEAIEAPPAFLAAPRPEYLRATEIRSIVEVFAPYL